MAMFPEPKPLATHLPPERMVKKAHEPFQMMLLNFSPLVKLYSSCSGAGRQLELGKLFIDCENLEIILIFYIIH